MPTFVRFERGRDGVVGPTYGPYPFVQFTYDILRVGPDGEELAYFHRDDWRIFQSHVQKGQEDYFSDVIIYDAEKADG